MFSDNIFSVCSNSSDGFVLCSDRDVSTCEALLQDYLDSHDDVSFEDFYIICSRDEPLYFGSVSGFVGYQEDFVYTDENGVEHDPIEEGNDSIYECEPYINNCGLIDFKAI